jgi:hypothetical protein
VLDSAITFLADEVNTYIKTRTGAALDVLETGGIADEQGKWAFNDALRLALVAVEEERAVREQLPERVLIDGRNVVLQPALKLNLVVVFAARLANYDDSLRYLSYVMTFFQAHPGFTPDEFPGLDPRIERLAPEMLSYGPEQLNQLWAYIGTKYLPSVAYRVRMVVLQDVGPLGIEKPITQIQSALHDK